MAASFRAFLDDLMAGGRYHFTAREVSRSLDISAGATRAALHRLNVKKHIASPARGFYVIVPPEYRRLGAPPPEQFVPALMRHLELPYYVGLLSAAQLLGAAHHRPQRFQVLVERPRRRLHLGSIHVEFIVRRRLAEVPTTQRNTPRGELVLSTPEATAIDLVGYSTHAGGIDNVVAVLVDLAEQLDPKALVRAAKTAPIAWAQRLGHLLETYAVTKSTEALARYVKQQASDYVWLVPSSDERVTAQSPRWKLRVNAEIEVDL